MNKFYKGGNKMDEVISKFDDNTLAISKTQVEMVSFEEQKRRVKSWKERIAELKKKEKVEIATAQKNLKREQDIFNQMVALGIKEKPVDIIEEV